MKAHEYHQIRAWSASSNEDYLADPTRYFLCHVERSMERSAPTQETEVGLGCHALVLEGAEAYEKAVAIWRGGLTKEGEHSMRRGTNAWKAFEAEARKAGKAIVSETDNDTIEAMATALHGHADARKLLFDLPGLAEHTLQWAVNGWSCKARLDRYLRAQRVIVDLKTTSADNFADVMRQAATLGYHRKAEWYMRGHLACYGEPARAFLFVSVRSHAPHHVWVWRFDSDWETAARIEVDEIVAGIQSRMESGDWRPRECHGLQVASPPLYLMRSETRDEVDRRRREEFAA